jgi:hypothetical protein
MTTTTTSRAATPFPVYSPAGMGAGAVAAAYGTYTFAANPTAADIIKMCKLPKGAVPIGGYFSCVDIDTGTETLDIDLGIAANGVDSADPDFFMNGGVFTGDAITDLPLTNAANYRVFTGPFPVTTLGAETTVQAVVNTAANATGTGAMWCVIYYVVA